MRGEGKRRREAKKHGRLEIGLSGPTPTGRDLVHGGGRPAPQRPQGRFPIAWLLCTGEARPIGNRALGACGPVVGLRRRGLNAEAIEHEA